ncbi:phosphoglycolate phosphatase [Oceanicaulis sp.]|uniref:phosphoglycolate phosphatase n=1 Tax=Oceanicaulis sp. TaxID=1924941 RepID=UPI003D286B50
MTPDLCDHTGALRLKSRIEAYWKERGHDVSVSLEAAGFTPALRGARTDVRSNMVNGLPLAAALNGVDRAALSDMKD